MAVKNKKSQSFDITICIPIYNTGKWLPECLDSVVSQSIWKKIFVILVNDSSTDYSEQIARNFARQYPDQVKLIQHLENKGLLAARYTSIIQIQTPYAMFLDSDDVLQPDACFALYNAIVKYDADVIMGRMCTLEGHKITNKNTAYMEKLFKDYQTTENIRLANDYSFAIWPVCGKLYRSEILKIAAYGSGSRDFPAISSGEDHLLSLSIFMKSQRFHIIKEFVYLYRFNEESLTNSGDLKKLIDYFLVALNILKLSIFYHNKKVWELASFFMYNLKQKFLRSEFGKTTDLAVINLFKLIKDIIHHEQKMLCLSDVLIQEGQIMKDFNISKLNNILELPEYVFFELPKPEFPKVSIIIPVYNIREYLAQCLESVLLQSERNIEIIVIDDASSDGSWDLIQNYAKYDARIVTLQHKKNQGQGAARNTGLELAKAPWVMFVDGDDYIDYHAVKTLLMQTVTYSHLEMISCDAAIYINEIGNFDFEKFSSSHENILVKDPFRHYCNIEYPIIWHSVWNKLFRYKLFLDNPCLRFSLDNCVEDFVLFVKILWCMKHPILSLSAQLYYYRYREYSTSNTYNDKIPSLVNGIWMIDQWSQQLDEKNLLLLQNRVSHEIIIWLKASDSDFKLRMILSDIPKDYSATVVKLLLKESALQNRWYRFGQLSRKRKIWVIVQVLSKKFKIYWLLKPFGKILVNFLKKNLKS